jgi:hypothetical protein
MTPLYGCWAAGHVLENKLKFVQTLGFLEFEKDQFASSTQDPGPKTQKAATLQKHIAVRSQRYTGDA